jgi:nucleoside-diphosphate-sugar epimerase
VAAARTDRKWRRVSNPKVEYYFGDLTDKTYVQDIIKGCDAIIHTAALSSPWGRYEDFHEANVTVQKLLIEAATEQEIDRFVYVSTPSMYFELKDKLNIKESDPLPRKFINSYAETKREAEIALEQSGIPFVSIRPRALLGRGDTIIMPRLIRAFDEGKLKIMGDGENIVDLTPVGNVADALILGLFTGEKGLNQIYNISNGNPVKLWDKVDLVLNKLGKELPKKKVPFWLVRTVAKFMEFKSNITNKKEPALTVYGVGTLTKSFTMDISKAKEFLGYEPQLSVDDAIDEFVEWYKEHESH